MSNYITTGPDGKPMFIGKEDPHNTPLPLTPTECPHGTESCSHMQCSFCHNYVDYLVGEDTPDGGRRGCESCYRPPKTPLKREADIPSDKDMGL